ncbi:hypothetical protein [Parasphingorhabdus sp.]|uniref:hypothetical protein n=1 Tax=Parasphingorhabdus sp. TaxID=2709688 RepID=UPI0032644380
MKIFDALIVSLAVLVFASSSAAFAQPEIGSRIDRSREGMTGFHDPLRQKSARAGLNAMMRCKAESHRARAMKTLELRYMSAEQTKSLDKIFNKVEYDDRCSLAKDIEYRISTGPTVGAFAEFFLLRKYNEKNVAALSKLTELDWQQDVMKPRNANEMFGRCLSQSGRNEVYNLVKTVPDTSAESDAIKSIVRLLGPCVTDGLEVKFDKTSLRAILAYGLFRSIHQHQEMLEARN